MKSILILIFSLLSFAAQSQRVISNGQNLPFIAGEDLTDGDAIFLNQLFSPPQVFKANIAGSKKQAVGFCTKTALEGDTTFVAVGGTIENFPYALTVGAKYYLSTTTPGAIVNAEPAGAIQAVGVAIDTYKMQVVLAPIRIAEVLPIGLSDVTAIDNETYNGIEFNNGSFGGTIQASNITATHTYQLPDTDGELLTNSGLSTIDLAFALANGNTSTSNSIILSDGATVDIKGSGLIVRDGHNDQSILVGNDVDGITLFSRDNSGDTGFGINIHHPDGGATADRDQKLPDADGTFALKEGNPSGTNTATGTATTTFTVTVPTQPNDTYTAFITPLNALSAALYYITNKTTTTFDVVYLAGLTGSVSFDWQILQQ